MVKILIIAFIVLLLSACGKFGSKTEPTSRKTVLSGGYTQQRPLNENERVLFRTATAKLDNVDYTPESVATQVVAGTNYRFVCTGATATRHPKTVKAEVIIYQPLPGQGEPRVTDIKQL